MVRCLHPYRHPNVQSFKCPSNPLLLKLRRKHKTVSAYNVVVPSCGRMRRGCCWMVMGEPGAEPDPELPDDMLGGWTSDR